MARPKRTSMEVTNATTRAAALTSIDANLDLGGGLTLTVYQKAIADTQAALASYNKALSLTDEALSTLRAAEKKLADLSDRMLSGVAAKWGRDSSEYAKAGGTRKSDRKRRTRKAAVA